MGLKIVAYGAVGEGKSIFCLTMAEVCNVGVIDTEQRWQHLTDPHPTVKPKFPGAEAVKRGVPADVYANPRIIRHDVPWLPKSQNVIWLVQTMDPQYAWECSKIWAQDPEIGGQVRDSASVLWDMLQDSRDPDPSLGGLAWVPVKKADRRMVYTLLESKQHWVLVAHVQETMNAEMKVTGTKPWIEKKSPHWADLVLRFSYSNLDPAPKCVVEKQKVLGGLGGAGLKLGTQFLGATFRQIMEKAGGERGLVSKAAALGEIEANTKRLLTGASAAPYNPAIDSDPKKEGQ